MLIRSTDAIHPDFHLVTLGGSCHYLVRNRNKFSLIDPGSSGTLPFLVRRIEDLGLRIGDLERVLITHCDADRISAIPYLRRLCGQFTLTGTAGLQLYLSRNDVAQSLFDADQALRSLVPANNALEPISVEAFRSGLQLDQPISESDQVQLSEDVFARAIYAPGHREHSFAYLIQPYDYLIGDEVLGYFRGRELAAPGADFSLARARSTLEKFGKLYLAGLCPPYVGVLTGDMVRKYLHDMIRNIDDLISETARALEEGVSIEVIRSAIAEQFFTFNDCGPLMDRAVRCSMRAILEQVAPSSSISPPESSETK